MRRRLRLLRRQLRDRARQRLRTEVLRLRSTSTYDVNQALAACAAFTGDAAKCVDYGVTCDANDDLVDDTAVVCGDASAIGDCACWAYSGTAVGYVYDEPGGNNCFCPLVGDPQWN